MIVSRPIISLLAGVICAVNGLPQISSYDWTQEDHLNLANSDNLNAWSSDSQWSSGNNAWSGGNDDWISSNYQWTGGNDDMISDNNPWSGANTGGQNLGESGGWSNPDPTWIQGGLDSTWTGGNLDTGYQHTSHQHSGHQHSGLQHQPVNNIWQAIPWRCLNQYVHQHNNHFNQIPMHDISSYSVPSVPSSSHPMGPSPYRPGGCRGCSPTCKEDCGCPEMAYVRQLIREGRYNADEWRHT